jgi:hypothetical protein
MGKRTTKLSTVAFLSLLLIGGGCSRGPVVSVPTAPQIAEFTRNAGIALPKSSRAIGWKESRGMDDALWLKVEIPKADLDSFIAASPFRGGGLETNQSSRLYDFYDFWQTPPSQYRAGQASLPNVRTLNMVVDDSASTNAVVYMMWFEM